MNGAILLLNQRNLGVHFWKEIEHSQITPQSRCLCLCCYCGTKLNEMSSKNTLQCRPGENMTLTAVDISSQMN